MKNWFEQRFVDVSQNPGAAELRYFLSEKLYLHPELRLPPTKTVMDLAKARFSPEDTDEMMYRAYVDAGVISRSADILRRMSAAGEAAAVRLPNRPSTWQFNDEVEVLRTVSSSGEYEGS